MNFILRVINGAAIFFVLGTCGITWAHWQMWAIFALLLVYTVLLAVE